MRLLSAKKLATYRQIAFHKPSLITLDYMVDNYICGSKTVQCKRLEIGKLFNAHPIKYKQQTNEIIFFFLCLFLLFLFTSPLQPVRTLLSLLSLLLFAISLAHRWIPFKEMIFCTDYFIDILFVFKQFPRSFSILHFSMETKKKL